MTILKRADKTLLIELPEKEFEELYAKAYDGKYYPRLDALRVAMGDLQNFLRVHQHVIRNMVAASHLILQASEVDAWAAKKDSN